MIIKHKYEFLRLLLYGILLMSLIVTAHASDYSGSLNPVLSVTPITHTTDPIVPEAWPFLGITPTSIQWVTQFDFIGIPDKFYMQSRVDCYTNGVGTFELSDVGGVYASGSIQFLNGSFTNSGKQYIYLTFTSWNAGTRTGAITGTLTITNIGSIIREDGGTSLFQAFLSEGNGWVAGQIPLYPDAGGGGEATGSVAIYTPYPYTTKYDYTIDTLSGTGTGRFSTVSFTKPANNLPTQVRIYSSTGTLLFSSSHTDSTTGESLTIIGSNYILSMYIPLTGEIYNTSAFYSTPIIINHTLSISPNPVTVNNIFSLSLSAGDYTGITEIRYGYTFVNTQDILYDSSGYTCDYILGIANHWYQYDGAAFSIDKGTSIPNPSNVIANFGSGIFEIQAYLISLSSGVQEVTNILTVSGTNNQALVIRGIDYKTGEIIGAPHIDVLNIATNIWDNRTAINGEQTFYYPFGQLLYIHLDALNYQDSNKNYTVSGADISAYDVIMYRGVSTPITNVTLRVNVLDDTNKVYLNNAKVTVLNDVSYFDSQSQYTNYAGMAIFTVLPNTDYAISVSKDGYKSAGKLINSGAGGNTLDTDILLIVGVNPTSTTTPMPTVTSGYIGGTGLGGNITPATCQIILPANSTLVDDIKNKIACMGVQSGSNQGYVFALGIIFILGIVGGKWGKGMGVVMGMSSGYVLSLAMGLVPLWTFIAMIIFICLILAIKLWASDAK